MFFSNYELFVIVIDDMRIVASGLTIYLLYYLMYECNLLPIKVSPLLVCGHEAERHIN